MRNPELYIRKDIRRLWKVERRNQPAKNPRALGRHSGQWWRGVVVGGGPWDFFCLNTSRLDAREAGHLGTPTGIEKKIKTPNQRLSLCQRTREGGQEARQKTSRRYLSQPYTTGALWPHPTQAPKMSGRSRLPALRGCMRSPYTPQGGAEKAKSEAWLSFPLSSSPLTLTLGGGGHTGSLVYHPIPTTGMTAEEF